MASPTKSALFVCLGNICRSPIAEAAMNLVVKEAGTSDQWRIDSAATANYHTGASPDSRGQAIMAKHGLTINHRARQLCKQDFEEFDYIFGMDEENIRNIKRVAPKTHRAKIELLGSYSGGPVEIIEDPYYEDGDLGFEKNLEQCLRCCRNFYKVYQ